jgi:hypothetical protein
LTISEERKKRVIDLYYNQGKTMREIAKIERMSIRDISAIIKEEEARRLQYKHQQHQEDLSAQAYKLFSDRKTPLEVAITLNLRESEATKFYREYWKLNQQHNLNMVYEETKGDIEPFIKLYRLSKSKGVGVKQVVDVLAIANNDLSAIEERFKRLRNDVGMRQFQKHTLERNLYQLNNQIASTTKLLNSIRISCIRERREIGNLQNEKARLEDTVTEFKNNNEEYLNKIKQAAEGKVKDVLTNSKLLLKFATFSVIESLRSNPELYNFISYSTSVETTSASYESNYLSLMSGGRQQQQSFNDTYTALILEEAEKLYNKLMTELTSSVIAASPAMSISSLPQPDNNNNRQKLTHKNDNIYQTEESRYNNHPEIYSNDQEQPNE